MTIKFKRPREVLIYAFRYALGRMTYATCDMCEEITANWDSLEEFDRRQIKRDITDAIDNNRAGMDCDVKGWRKILDLPDE